MSLHFDYSPGDGKADTACRGIDTICCGAIGQFCRNTASLANEELSAMAIHRTSAADEGIQAFNAMDQPLREQKVQCPINGGRRHTTALCPQLLQQFIGTIGAML